MKNLLFSFLILYSWSGYSSGFRFPNIEYSYAKLYFFNLELDQPGHMDYRIYDQGEYAASKIGNGFLLSSDFHSKITIALKKGIDELITGLSKCFMPRHGIIYYDQNHLPVASLSICFECDKISVWSYKPLTFIDDYKHFNYEKAERQIIALAHAIKEEGIPVYYSLDESEQYFDFEPSTKIKDNRIEWNETNKNLLPFLKDSLISAINSFQIHNDISGYSQVTDTIIKIGELNWACKHITYRGKNHFYFFEGKLIKASWRSPKLVVFQNIKIGMSWNELRNLTNFRANSEEIGPDRLQLNYKDWQVSFEFKYQTLISIRLLKNSLIE